MNSKRREDADYRYIEQREHQWHIDKRVSVGHIITTAMIAFGLMGAWVQTQTRISMLETKFSEHIKYNNIERERSKEQYQEIKASLLRIEEKLNAKVDKS